MRTVLMSVALLVALVVSVGGVAAQQREPQMTYPYMCPYPNGAYYQSNVFPHYEARNQRFLLVDWTTGAEIRSLETLPKMHEGFSLLAWSPNCQYLVARAGRRLRISDDYSIVIWDVTAGHIVREFLNTFESNAREAFWYPQIAWSPDSSRAILATTQGYLLWQPETDHTVVLTSSARYRSANLDRVWWDEPRNQVALTGEQMIMIYDLQTGIEKSSFGVGDNPLFFVSDDQNYLIAYPYGAGSMVSVWDLNNATETDIFVDGRTAANPDLPTQIALSPNHRYLVVGYDALRVWDLQNLPENVDDRDPIYRHGGPDAPISSVRFVDDSTIETTSADGVQRWDVTTGVYVPSE